VASRLTEEMGAVTARLLPLALVGPPEKLKPPGREIFAHFRRPHPEYGITGYRTVGRALQAVADPRAWRAGARAGRLYVISGVRPGVFLAPEPPPGSGLRLAGRRSFEGIDTVRVDEYLAAPAAG
jgi:hypothetical protein